MNFNRGYFGIGIYNGKAESNVGTLWRSAFQLGASFIFTIGRRYPQQSSDTTKCWKHVPAFVYSQWDEFFAGRPFDCPLIGIEMGGLPLDGFYHPERAIYLLGAEDNGLPPAVLNCCQQVVSIPSVRTESYNVSVAGSIVMYDRLIKHRSRV